MLSNCEIILSTTAAAYPEYVFKVTGKSMADFPHLVFDGDLIHTDHKKDATSDILNGSFPLDKMVVVQSFHNREFVAKIKGVDAATGLITFTFLNRDKSAFPDQSLSVGNINAIYRVIAVSKESRSEGKGLGMIIASESMFMKSEKGGVSCA
jgi:hypothetical protein